MQPTFFDYALQYQGGKKTDSFLSQIKQFIPYKEIVKKLIEVGIYKPNEGQQGRPSIRAEILIGALILQSFYGLSDPMTEELIHDRISFRKFLDIHEEDDIPDETTICKFRNALIREGLLEWIFELVKSKIDEKGLIVNKGTIVDATIIHSPEPKKRRLSDGTIKKSAYDSDARYTSKRGKKYHGYKMHVATDINGVITKVVYTPANEHDSTQIKYLVQQEKRAIFADSGYMAEKLKVECRRNGLYYGVIERRVRGQSKLRKKQIKKNKRIASIRAIVEYPFAILKRVMKYTEARYRGLYKNRQHSYLLAAVYNIIRMKSLLAQQA